MLKKRLQQFRVLLAKEPRRFHFEPVTHRLDPHPVLPQGLMRSIAPAYDEVLAQEHRENEAQDRPDET